MTNAIITPDTASAPPTPTSPFLPAAFDFQPKTLSEAMELSKMLADSTLVPKDFQNNAANCFIAMQWGAELGFKLLQALQNIAVINGKPGLYGDAGKALLLSNGCQIIEDDMAEIAAKKRASCTIRRHGRPDVTRTFSVADAETAGLWKKTGPWSTYPYRQMAWRAFWFAARDAAADILKGMGGVEELRDYQLEKDVTSESTATPVSKSDKVAEGLKKIKLADVVSAFQKATDAEALAAAVALATKMKGSDEDKAAANAAYHEAKKRLSQPKSPDDTAPRPTIAEVRALLSRAENVDDLDAAAGMIDALADPDDMKDALRSDYKTLREEMASEAA